MVQEIQETSRQLASPGVDFPLEHTGTTNHTNLLLASSLVANLEQLYIAFMESFCGSTKLQIIWNKCIVSTDFSCRFQFLKSVILW